MIGLGTLVNVATIIGGSAIGVLLGSRLPEKTNRTVTEALGLLTLVLAGLNLVSLTDKGFVTAAGQVGTFMIVIFAMLFGTITGSLLGIERRLESFGGWLQKRLSRGKTQSGEARERFITGYVDASLIFAIGPMAILGSIADGTDHDPNTLIIKAILDGFACIAFAASLGWGVAASSITVGLWQGLVTLVAAFAGAFIPGAMIAAITATGGVLMLAISLRLLNLKPIAVADMLPALAFAPLFTWGVSAFFGN
ncbi:MAG: hypothetical protein RL645_153 [Actinomycetota bacterium]|jgi:uncharacterized membrane protein YqgA involved in biofilm formation